MEKPPAGTSPMAMVGPFAAPSGVVAPFTNGAVMTGAPESSSITWNAIGGPLPPDIEWVPKPETTSCAYPSHSVAGSKVAGFVLTPLVTALLRRIVFSAVEVSPLPHSVPGSVPITPMMSAYRLAAVLVRAMASSPL